MYRLGNGLSLRPQFTILHQTRDAYEVTTTLNQDPELGVVAEDGETVGFALATTYEKEKGAWKCGHARRGVRMILGDTSSTNTRAPEFFRHTGSQER